MKKHIISHGQFIVRNIVIEAKDGDEALEIAKAVSLQDERWTDCGSCPEMELYQCEGEV